MSSENNNVLSLPARVLIALLLWYGALLGTSYILNLFPPGEWTKPVAFIQGMVITWYTFEFCFGKTWRDGYKG